MKLYVSVLITFLFLTGIAFGAVGDAGVSDGISSVQSGQAYLAGAGTSGMASSPTSYQAPQMGSSQYPQQNQQAAGYQPSAQSSQSYASVAPQIGGPYEERMSADDLGLPQPQAESFQPDSDLNFISATPPSVSGETYGAIQGAGQGADQGAGQGADQGTGQETGSWYYPGSVTSRNKFKVQTFSGLKTVAGCSYGGYLPLWSDINSAGNFYVYEWYPGQWTPSVRWWGWTWPGYKKGWFTGDVPGWHILSYNCRDWSNYIYIYVSPNGSGDYSSGYRTDYRTDNSAGYNAGYSTGTPAAAASEPLPSGAPTPPDPNAENLILPDFNLLSLSTGQSSIAAGASGSYAAGTAGIVGTAGYPSQGTINNPVQGTPASYLASYAPHIPQVGYTQGIMPAASTAGRQAQKVCTACADQGSYTGYSGYSGTTAQAAPYGYAAQSQTYQTVFPKSSTCRCNEYYVSVGQNKLSTVGSVRCGEWLPLWSKVSRPGIYWSFEWTQCGSPAGYYCQPEVRSFGYKAAGWHQTWFRGNKLGWHILSYCSGDWSNYIYIYVWPSS